MVGVFSPTPAALREEDADPDSTSEAPVRLPGSLQTYVSIALTEDERAVLDKRAIPAPDMQERRTLPEHVRQQKDGNQLAASASILLPPEGEGLAIDMSNGGDFTAVGCRDGQVRVYQAASGACQYTLGTAETGSASSAPVTALQFRPESSATETKNVLVAAKGEALYHLHATTGQVLNTASERKNCIYTLRLSSDGCQLATAGSDCHVRIYDEATQRCIVDLAGGGGLDIAGHSNHVYSVRWHPDDPQVLLSGGWDQTVQIWDLRTGSAVRSVFGPYICGDALDVHGSTILTGSWRDEAPLQLWDYGSGMLETNLPFYQPNKGACQLYAAAFVAGTSGKTIACGGSGKQPFLRVMSKNGNVHGTMMTTSTVHAITSANHATGSQIWACCAGALEVLDV